MADFKGEEFKFPDEAEQAEENKLEIEIEDDTPETDRGRKAAPPPEDPSDDELESYDEKVKQRIKRFTRGYHDERRAKEEAQRMAQAAEEYAKHVLLENQNLQKQLAEGSQQYISTAKTAAESRLATAKSKLKTAFEAGDADGLAEAQSEIADATAEMRETSRLKPIEVKEKEYSPPQQTQRQTQSPRTEQWLENNGDWFGKDDEMTMAAMGIDKRLQREYGADYVGSKEYFQEVDKTMRKRFPEYFGAKNSGDEPEEPAPSRAKSATVVAPASRSTPPSRIRLKASQVTLARRLGITPEQYAKQVALMNRGE
jgi:hypothetical protein